MLKKIFLFFKKFILSTLVIFTFNKLSLSLNIIVPINLITILLISFFGLPSLIGLVIFYIICI